MSKSATRTTIDKSTTNQVQQTETLTVETGVMNPMSMKMNECRILGKYKQWGELKCRCFLVRNESANGEMANWTRHNNSRRQVTWPWKHTTVAEHCNDNYEIWNKRQKPKTDPTALLSINISWKYCEMMNLEPVKTFKIPGLFSFLWFAMRFSNSFFQLTALMDGILYYRPFVPINSFIVHWFFRGNLLKISHHWQ